MTDTTTDNDIPQDAPLPDGPLDAHRIPWADFAPLAELDPDARRSAISAMAAAWVDESKNSAEAGTTTAAELTRLVHEVGGHEMFIAVLATEEGAPRRLAGVLAASSFLESNIDVILDMTRYKEKEVNGTIRDIDDLTFDGKIEQARARAIEAVTNLYKSIGYIIRRKKFSDALRADADKFSAKVAKVLEALDTRVPEYSNGDWH